MSLIPPRKGNPNWVPGVAQNPNGRPKGSVAKPKDKVKDKLKEKGVDPIQELITLAELLKASDKYEEAAEIWLKIQEYCEPKKKAVETIPEKPITPEQSKENVDDMLRLLEEASEDNGQQNEGSSDTDSLDAGKPEIQAETSPEDNSQKPTGE